MIIKKIAIENFQCYSGSLEQNTFEFKEGLNVIIGDNGSGKSKLYDAFYWVLYDKIFNSTNRDFRSSSDVNTELISDQAKANTSEGDHVKAIVQIHLIDNNQKTSHPDEYILERSYDIKRKNGKLPFNVNDAWELPSRSIKKIEKKDILDFKPCGDQDFDRVANKLLPSNMKPYLWFQGEQVDSLIDFKKQDSLTNAIEVLSDIKKYDTLIEVAEKVQLQAEKAYRSEVNKRAKASSEIDELQREETVLIKQIEKDKDNLKKIEENYVRADNNREDLMSQIDDAEKYNKLKLKIKNAIEKKDELNKQINEKQKQFNSNLFKKNWILKGAAPFYDEFEELMREYEEKRENLKLQHKIKEQQDTARTHKLPENVPNKSYLKSMLKDEHCYLCDREFEYGDKAYDHINELFEGAKHSKINYSDFLKNDFKKDLETLKVNSAYIRRNVIENIDLSIREEIELIEGKTDQKDKAITELEQLTSELENLLASSKLDEGDTDNILGSFRNINKSIDELKEQQTNIKNRLDTNKTKLEEKQEAIRNCAGSDIDQKVVRNKEILEDYLEITKITRKIVYEEQIKRIEKEANKHFYKMTEDNQAVRGKIILEKRGQSYMPVNVDEEGNRLSSPNDANIILIKIATILAIVTAKSGSHEHYPMISDAPTSKFSDNYTIGFCKAISDVFNQSIIVSYDFYHNQELRKRLLEDVENLGSVYIIDPSVKEEERMNRTELSTMIKSVR
ncbi:MAG: AAA family ATPase [archaeon]